MDSAEVSSSMPPPTWKLASEMEKNSRICRPTSAQVAITAKALRAEISTVRRRCWRLKPCV
ncbi:hypothetical protein D9M68_977090 [compost metagenome]